MNSQYQLQTEAEVNSLIIMLAALITIVEQLIADDSHIYTHPTIKRVGEKTGAWGDSVKEFFSKNSENNDPARLMSLIEDLEIRMDMICKLNNNNTNH